MVLLEEQNYQEILQEKAALQDENTLLKAENQWYKEQFKLLKHREFGPKAETSAPGQQTLVFNEAEQTAKPDAPEPTETTIEVPAHKRKTKGQRERLLKDLPVEEIKYQLEGDDLTCPNCQGELHEVGTEIRQEVEIIPPQFKLVKHCQSKYCCRNCHNEGENVLFKTAPMPKPAFPGSLASPSAVAYILVQKFVMGTPLYRQEQNLKHWGLPLSRQTLANWMLWGAEWLQPLYERMKTHLLALGILHGDETEMQVLNEPARKAQSKSYIWLYISGRAGPPIVIYEYQETRGAEHPKRFLADFSGFLHVDGYQVYEGLPGVTPVGCWAHARRKFVESIRTLPSSVQEKGGTASHIGLEYCNRLFKIEREIEEEFEKRDAIEPMSEEQKAEERKAARAQFSKPVLDAFRSWLEVQSLDALPKSILGQAISYTLKQWSKLIMFLEDGLLEIDNNRAERAIKPFVIGRKNWLFANTPCGAKSSAMTYSIVETAKQNDLNPLAYITYLFETLPNIDLKQPGNLDALLPWNPNIQSRFGSPNNRQF